MRRIIHLSFFRAPLASLSFLSRYPPLAVPPSARKYLGSLSDPPNSEELFGPVLNNFDPFSRALVKKLFCGPADVFSCFLPKPREKLEVCGGCSATLLGVKPGPDS